MKRLSDKARLYARSYGQPPYGMEIEGTADLLLQMADKLAEYEDFEEIFRSKMTDAVCDFLKDKEEFAKWLDRNRWITKKCDGYARAEDQGELLKLPAPVGSLVYEPYQFGGEGAWEIDVHRISLEDLDKIGKTVFLTREEAEAALKGLSGTAE